MQSTLVNKSVNYEVPELPFHAIITPLNKTKSNRPFNIFVFIKLTKCLDNLRQYFSQFGEVRDVDIKIDMATQQSRGFGFVLFAHADSITAVEQAGEHNLGIVF